MNILDQTQINLKRISKYKSKTLMVVVPITFLMATGIVIASQIDNFKVATEQSFFGSIAEAAKLIDLKKNTDMTFGGPGGGTFSIRSGSNSDNNYTEADLQNIKSIDGVEDAEFVSNLPVGAASVTNLFDVQFKLNNLVGIGVNLASLYTDEDFNYKDGEAIPIIINANSFIEQYQDWGDKTEITQELQRPTPGSRNAPQNMAITSPIKTKSISYKKEDLIGKEFEIEFGSLDELQNFKTDFASEKITFTKLTEEEMTAKEQSRKEAIGKYWDYSKLSTPLKYKFVVVGVIEDNNDFNSYIPSDFASKVMKDLIQKQLDARNSTAISNDLLNSTYLGMSFDGTKLTSGGLNFGGAVRMIRMGGPGGAQSSAVESSQTDSYTIPGLIIETEKSNTAINNPFSSQGDVIGEYKDVEVYDKSVKTSDRIVIKAEDVFARSEIVGQLNKQGFAYQDTLKLSVFDDLKSAFNVLSIVTVVGFIAIGSFIILFVLGKFVDDAKREIGVIRALGASAADVRNIFLGLGLILVTIAGFAGVLVGVVSNLVLSSIAREAFQNTVAAAVKESFNVAIQSDLGLFTRLNIQAVFVYITMLFVIAVIISLMNSLRASRLTPIEIIKGE